MLWTERHKSGDVAILPAGHEKISFLQENLGAVHGYPAKDTVTGRKSERALS